MTNTKAIKELETTIANFLGRESNRVSLGDAQDMYEGFVQCAIWAQGIEQHHITTDRLTELSIIRDCIAFIALNASLIETFLDDMPNVTMEDLGHNFYLERNGCGTGFWDRDWGLAGERFSKTSEYFKEIHLDMYKGCLVGMV